jgi:hypothetical protein
MRLAAQAVLTTRRTCTRQTSTTMTSLLGSTRAMGSWEGGETLGRGWEGSSRTFADTQEHGPKARDRDGAVRWQPPKKSSSTHHSSGINRPLPGSPQNCLTECTSTSHQRGHSRPNRGLLVVSVAGRKMMMRVQALRGGWSVWRSRMCAPGAPRPHGAHSQTAQAIAGRVQTFINPGRCKPTTRCASRSLSTFHAKAQG